MRAITNNYRDTSRIESRLRRRTWSLSRDPNGRRSRRSLSKGADVCAPSGWALGGFQRVRLQGKPEAMDEIVFSTTTEVIEAFGKLMGLPQILDLPVDEAGLKAWIERQKSGNPLEAAHEWAVGYRERHRKKRRGQSESTLWARILPQRKRLPKI